MGPQTLTALLHRLADELDGDWLVVGGAIVAVWLNDARVTEDIDVVGLSGDVNQRYALIDFCVRAGVSVEAVNSAADFFVRQIPDWQTQTRLLFSGVRGRILRPTTTLFLLLKMKRLSESDLDDCQRWLEHTDREPADTPRVLLALDALPAPATEAQRQRREHLRRLVEATPPALG